MRLASLFVYDDTASCELYLPEYTSLKVFNELKEGSVLVLRNAAAILDSKDKLILTLPSKKYSHV